MITLTTFEPAMSTEPLDTPATAGDPPPPSI
jgi:hypothetical protein